MPGSDRTEPTSASTPRARLADVSLPDFGEPTVEPAIPAATYRARIAAALRRAASANLDALVVYGDREHSANVAYLTGYDPRFEETLLVLHAAARPALFVGNEGWGYAELAAGDFERVLCQTFSLLGQPRDRNPPFADLLRRAGLTAEMRVGAVGWKSFGAGDPGATPHWLEIPSFIAEQLRSVARDVVNATDLFMNPVDGLRAINDVDQLAAFEFASCFSSGAIRRLVTDVQPGMTELQAGRLLQLTGLPHAAHTMLSAGPRARFGLPSPSLRRLERGDPVTSAVSHWGALNARAGFLVADANELPAGIRDYVDRLVAPYFAAVADWYETVGIGVTGGALHAAIHRPLADKFFGIGLNPGHLIHLDEWLHSPIFAGSTIPLRSGMALQVDVIPATGTPYFTTNIEDGIALADAALRDEFATAYPEAWARIAARRHFMEHALGIRLKAEVLPFSNIPAWLPPFWLSAHRAMVRT